MAPVSLPRITITAPDGQQRPVVLIPLPATADELSPFSEFLPGPAPAPAPPSPPSNGRAELYAQQTREDAVYSQWPDIVSDYKTLRVAVEEFEGNRCRFCGRKFKSWKVLNSHVRRPQHLKSCRIGRQIIDRRRREQREEKRKTVDDEDNDEDPPTKKQKEN
ncbi:hypothetical protein IL306_011906 [Fusarium sp. DS 682]|nr:hypothetical protein IL306_011906 [Fusarium sp. DS 682]